MKFTLGRKLSFGFGVVILLMLVTSVVSYMQLNKLHEIEQRVTTLRFPTIVSGRDLLNGINSSLAALRGYMILGEDISQGGKMKASRNVAWEEIDQALSQFNGYSKNWTVPANINKLQEMKSLIEEFRQAQNEVEDVSHTSKNIPAYTILLNEAAPRAAKTLAAVTAIINEEENLPATLARKNLLRNLADSRGSFAIGLANIRAYLLSGDNTFRSKFKQSWQDNEQAFIKLKQQQTLFNSLQQKHWKIYLDQRSEFAQLPVQMFTLRSSEKWNQANYLLATEAAPLAKRIKEIIAEMKTSQDELVAKDILLLASTINQTDMVLLIVTLFAVFIAIVIAFFLTSNMTNPIRLILERAQDIADGDLSKPALGINSQDELGDLIHVINLMSSSLNKLIISVTQAATEVSGGAVQLSTGNAQISHAMDEQSQKILMVASAMEEMSASVNEVARNSSEASTRSTDSEGMAGEGKKAVGKTVDEMRKINEVVSLAAESVKQLGERGDDIGTIITVINGIADQTNLLALNAAIEAARAGEQGRGFAVVADEVRQLAQRTVKATEEIKVSINQLQQQTHQVIDQMADSTQHVQSGVKLAENTGESLEQIFTCVQDVTSNIHSIASTSEQQSAVSIEVAENVNSIATASEESAATTLEASSSTNALSENASELMSLVNRFKTTNEVDNKPVGS